MENATEVPVDPPAETARPPRRHVYLAHVRFADLDPLNHVNNVQMLTYLEDARIAFLRWGAEDDSESLFNGLVVARHEVDYLRPLLLRQEPVRVETWVSEVKNASFRLRYEILDEERIYLRASSVIVGFDLNAQAARRLTTAEREYLMPFISAA